MAMKPDTEKSPTSGNRNKRRPPRTWAFVWAGIGILTFLAAGFFLSTTVLFRSAYTEPKQEEARRVLTSLYESEMGYFARHKCFSSNPADLDFNPETSKRYEWAVIAADCTSFVARAWGNLDGDSNLDIWEITNDDAFRPLHVFDDKKDVGYRIDPRSTRRWRPVDGYFKPPVSER
jgi:hypothetical protein